jgi:Flp pilus assembly protein TadG
VTAADWRGIPPFFYGSKVWREIGQNHRPRGSSCFRLPVVSRIGRQLARFAGAEQGNIAVIFAIALVPVLTFVGAAVDYSRAVQARSSMQAALDSTALMLSKDLSSGAITTAQISTKATAYFNALFTDTSTLPTVAVTATYTASTSMGSTIQVIGDGNFTTTFMKIAGYPTLDINTSSTSAWGTQPYDTQSTTPTTSNVATLFPADEYYENGQYYCKTGNSPQLQPIMPLSYDWSSIKTTINNMQPTGGTNQPIGLAWAWMTLQQSSPMNAPALDSNYTYKQAIILLSDGLNTEDRWPSYGNGSTQYNGLIDARQKILCDNIKAQGVTIYAVQVNTGSDPTSTVMQYCASSSDKFFLITSANQTVSVFQSIGTSLSKLRVAR